MLISLYHTTINAEALFAQPCIFIVSWKEEKYHQVILVTLRDVRPTSVVQHINKLANIPTTKGTLSELKQI